MPAIDDLLKTIVPLVSGHRAWNDVAAISQHHRIQFSPGFAASASLCRDRLLEAGLSVEILTFPAGQDARYWSFCPPQCWHPRAATLDIVSPDSDSRRLADFSIFPVSLISRSQATPPGGLTADLVVVERGDTDDGYADIDVGGRIVLTRGNPAAVHEFAIARRGARGIILDQLPEFAPVRLAGDLPDAIGYWMFPLSLDIPGGFGFSLSGREGARLRELDRQANKDGAGVRLRAVVDADFGPGEFEVVSAVLEGRTDEEILLIAHLCHPQPSANDNASGCGALIEAARTLKALLRDGILPLPDRTIRFLLVPEMTGTLAFLSANPDYKGKCLAALNLDMVGQDQLACGSTLLVEYPPRATPSFAGPVLSTIMDRLVCQSRTPTGGQSFPDCRISTVPYSGGSDHYILSDPRVGIPCPMLIQWPDRFYHTSADTLDRVSPLSLHRAAAAACTYLYFLATAGKAETSTIMHDVAARFPDQIRGLLVDVAAGRPALGLVSARIRFLAERTADDVRSAMALVSDDVRGELAELADALAQKVLSYADLTVSGLERLSIIDESPPPADDTDSRAATVRPKLVYPGPVFVIPRSACESEEQRAQEAGKELELMPRLHLLGTVICYWLDGQRTLAEAMDLAELETGLRDDEAVCAFIDLLVGRGLVTID